MTGIMGTWELRAQFGGIAGISNHYPPGNNHQLQLNSDSTFIYYENLAIVNQGTFKVVKDGIVIGTQKFDGIYYNYSLYGNAVQLTKDTLKIGLDFDDGIESDYVRKL